MAPCCAYVLLNSPLKNGNRKKAATASPLQITKLVLVWQCLQVWVDVERRLMTQQRWLEYHDGVCSIILPKLQSAERPKVYFIANIFLRVLPFRDKIWFCACHEEVVRIAFA